MRQRRAERAVDRLVEIIEAPIEKHEHLFAPTVTRREDGSWPPCQRVMLCECGETDQMKPELYFRPEDIEEFYRGTRGNA